MSVGSPTAGTWSSSQWRPDNEFETDSVLLLAPTGKARVQLETKTELAGAFTIVQFLKRYGERFEPETGRYAVTGSADRCGNFRTVIVDECSMRTEEQLAALLDGTASAYSARPASDSLLV